jgi:hypothetical protein
MSVKAAVMAVMAALLALLVLAQGRVAMQGLAVTLNRAKAVVTQDLEAAVALGESL